VCLCVCACRLRIVHVPHRDPDAPVMFFVHGLGEHTTPTHTHTRQTSYHIGTRAQASLSAYALTPARTRMCIRSHTFTHAHSRTHRPTHPYHIPAGGAAEAHIPQHSHSRTRTHSRTHSRTPSHSITLTLINTHPHTDKWVEQLKPTYPRTLTHPKTHTHSHSNPHPHSHSNLHPHSHSHTRIPRRVRHPVGGAARVLPATLYGSDVGLRGPRHERQTDRVRMHTHTYIHTHVCTAPLSHAMTRTHTHTYTHILTIPPTHSHQRTHTRTHTHTQLEALPQ